MKNTECCNQDCRQGRDCPLRTGKAQEPEQQPDAPAKAAIATLTSLGYTWIGGEQWKPPIGKAPDFNLLDAKNARIAELESQLAAVQQGVQPIGYIHPQNIDRLNRGESVALRKNGWDGEPNQMAVYATHPTTQWLDAQDAVRLMFVMQDIDGFEGIARDKYDYAQSCATENGRDEPIEADELNGLRRLIDAALAAQAKQGEQANG